MLLVGSLGSVIVICVCFLSPGKCHFVVVASASSVSCVRAPILTVQNERIVFWPSNRHIKNRQGDQDTTKVGKRLSRALSKVSATGFTYPPSSVLSTIQCASVCLSMPRPHWMKPVAETFERALDMRFPTFVVP